MLGFLQRVLVNPRITTLPREVYSYIIRCALPFELTIQAAAPGVPDTGPPDTAYTCTDGTWYFQGSLGLAEYWIDHKLAPKDQRWISACLFARVNLFVTAESISLRGPHDSLTVGLDETELYNVAEGAFYGNIFSDAGDCADYTPVSPSPYACKIIEGGQGPYEDCHTEAGAGKWPSLKTYREVITTYVAAD